MAVRCCGYFGRVRTRHVGFCAYCLGNRTMKEILYDWGGANVWLFHAINDIRFGGLDQVMLLGTTLGDHMLFPLYLGILTLFALVVVNTPFQDTSHHRVRVSRWMAVIAVFSLAYQLDG